MMPRRMQPPQPVDVESPQWLARAWQWVFDSLSHLDACLDEEKKVRENLTASLEAWMIAGKSADDDIAEQWKKHVQFHIEGEKAAAAKKSVWRFQGEVLSKLLKYATEGAGLAVVVYVLKQAGVL